VDVVEFIDMLSAYSSECD